MNRREWLLGALGVAGGLTTTGLLAACAEARDDAAGAGGPLVSGDLGVQLYTLRTLLEHDVPGTLRTVADIGYREAEPAGLYGLSATEFKAQLDAVGMVAPSAHISIDRIRDDLDGVIQEAKILGHRYIIAPSPSLNDRGPDGYRWLADDLNRAGAVTREAEIMLGFHNHDWDLWEVEGDRGWDILLAETDPELVTFQMDVYWIVEGGGDPLAYLREHPGRFRSIHAKGRSPGGDMVPVGRGMIDWARLLPALRAQGLEHIFVEHDHPEDPVASVRSSYDYLTDGAA